MVDDIVSYLRTEFDSVADKEKAPQMKAYMKNKFEFAGVSSPVRKDITKFAFKQFTITSEVELFDLAEKLWALPEREFQYVAVDFLYKYRKLVSENAINRFEYFIITKSWWDTVDAIDTDCVGEFFLRFPPLREKQIDIWLNSGNIWLQRVCIDHQLLYKEKTNVEILKKCILHCKDSNEFFIQKAIGWSLRQYARVDSQFVLEFVNSNTLKPLSRREALKHL